MKKGKTAGCSGLIKHLLCIHCFFAYVFVYRVVDNRSCNSLEMIQLLCRLQHYGLNEKWSTFTLLKCRKSTKWSSQHSCFISDSYWRLFNSI